MSYFTKRAEALPYSVSLAKRAAALLLVYNVWGRVEHRMDFR